MERIRSPSSTLDFKTPHEVWTANAPGLDYLRVFGCSAYAHVKDEKLNRKKLKCMFIDYPQGVKVEVKPLTLKDAIVSDSKKQWKDALEAELFSLQKNQTWSLVSKNPNKKLIQSKWIYKIKPGTGCDSRPRYNARLEAKGYIHKEGVDLLS
ncbi:retrotransposon protein, putative, unclassified [Cucumis melo var. makuwa]|uniref:Retrotransposon protein, putative, unclassified n=1 Tax=Cucumis melo var. makuwa TaxID=1194695 RepID=A0A5A7T3Z9_CUCMM|nr:retrotransposon protein, putative, unclassified [Cucumis melo var. makuwa]TYK19739.1 retrotransposon protein, putative, unclassified [Cucumis melo var. makuwa]